MAKLGNKLQDFRKEKKLTQRDLADILGVTQVHVSRVESGTANLSKNLEAKILSIIGDAGQGFEFTLKTVSDDHWNFASFVYGENTSGDRVRLNKKALNTKSVLFHCDASGHDLIAKYMADNLVIGLETVIGTIQNELICTSEYIYKSLNEMVKNTKDFWRGDPSCNLFVLNRESEKIQVLNGGMPNVWLVQKGKRDVIETDDIKWPPLGGLGKRVFPYSKEVFLEKGDALFSFSDGFIEEFEKHSTVNLKTHVVSICRALKGDAESIGTKLLRTLNDSLRSSKIEDDISFTIISKA